MSTVGGCGTIEAVADGGWRRSVQRCAACARGRWVDGGGGRKNNKSSQENNLSNRPPLLSSLVTL